MSKALIGWSGFVGSTLLRQTPFDATYRSTDVQEIAGKTFDTIVCCAAPAAKWIANKDPESDLKNIQRLIGVLAETKCQDFILISTVDVFKEPKGVDEDSIAEDTEIHAYGLNRLYLEKAIMEISQRNSTFQRVCIARLSGLVGPGLKKNIIFDLANNNMLDKLDPKAVFQFYPMVNLWRDLQIALKSNLPLVHLTGAPISVHQVAQDGFGIKITNPSPISSPYYDFRSKHWELFGGVRCEDGKGGYQYSLKETLLAIRAYAQEASLQKNQFPS